VRRGRSEDFIYYDHTAPCRGPDERRQLARCRLAGVWLGRQANPPVLRYRSRRRVKCKLAENLPTLQQGHLFSHVRVVLGEQAHSLGEGGCPPRASSAYLRICRWACRCRADSTAPEPFQVLVAEPAVPAGRAVDAEHLLAVPGAVHIGGVEQRDPQLYRSPDRPNRLPVVGRSPATCLPSMVNGPPIAQHPNPISLTVMPLRPKTLLIPVPFAVRRSSRYQPPSWSTLQVKTSCPAAQARVHAHPRRSGSPSRSTPDHVP
jgi:hypothetical protein